MHIDDGAHDHRVLAEQVPVRRWRAMNEMIIGNEYVWV